MTKCLDQVGHCMPVGKGGCACLQGTVLIKLIEKICLLWEALFPGQETLEYTMVQNSNGVLHCSLLLTVGVT